MISLDTHKGLSRPWVANQRPRARLPLSRTLFGAIIALRGVFCGSGFGAVFPESDTSNVANARNAATDGPPRPLRVPLRVFLSKISDLLQPQRCNASSRAYDVCARHSCAHACAITCATVAALQRCALSLLFLYLPEKKEEKKGNALCSAATPAFLTVAGGVAAWVSACLIGGKSLISLETYKIWGGNRGH